MSNPLGNIKHGGHGTLTYARWKSMMQRCHDSNADNFKHYGGAGITVCERWHDADASAAGETIGSRTPAPTCCHVVPMLLEGPNDQRAIEAVMDLLREKGSYAAPGFMKPEGIVIYHCASRTLYKKTLEKDEQPKSLAA